MYSAKNRGFIEIEITQLRLRLEHRTEFGLNLGRFDLWDAINSFEIKFALNSTSVFRLVSVFEFELGSDLECFTLCIGGHQLSRVAIQRV